MNVIREPGQTQAGMTLLSITVVAALVGLFSILALQVTTAGSDRAASLGESFQHRTRARNLLRTIAREVERTTTESPAFSTSPAGGGMRFSLPERYVGGTPTLLGISLEVLPLMTEWVAGEDEVVYGEPITYRIQDGVLVRIQGERVIPLMGNCIHFDVEPRSDDPRRLVLYLTVSGEGAPTNRFREEIQAALLK